MCLHGDLLAHIALEPARPPALQTFAVTLLEPTTSPVGMRLAEVVDELRAAGVAMLPSEEEFARGPSVVRAPLSRSKLICAGRQTSSVDVDALQVGQSHQMSLSRCSYSLRYPQECPSPPVRSLR